MWGRGRAYLTIKININFSVRNEDLNILHMRIFKKSIFFKITGKIFLGWDDHFLGNGVSGQQK